MVLDRRPNPKKPPPTITATAGAPTVAPPECVRTLQASNHRVEVPYETMRSWGLHYGAQHNPSVLVRNGELLVIVRVLMGRTSHNVMGRIGDDWSLVSSRPVQDLVASPPRWAQAWTAGYEDCRLIDVDGKLMAVAVVNDRVPDDQRPKICLLEFNDAGDVTSCRLQVPSSQQKNWMPIIGTSPLRMIYSVEPKAVRFANEETEGGPLGTMRGSSQLVPHRGGYLAIVHEVCALPGINKYSHRFVRFNENLDVVSKSDPFCFQEYTVEFCAGLAYWREQWVASYGLRDREAWIAVVSPETVERMLP